MTKCEIQRFQDVFDVQITTPEAKYTASNTVLNEPYKLYRFDLMRKPQLFLWKITRPPVADIDPIVPCRN